MSDSLQQRITAAMNEESQATATYIRQTLFDVLAEVAKGRCEQDIYVAQLNKSTGGCGVCIVCIAKQGARGRGNGRGIFDGSEETPMGT